MSIIRTMPEYKKWQISLSSRSVSRFCTWGKSPSLYKGCKRFMQISEKTNKKLDLVKINSAQKQVVAGLNYVLVVETAAESEKETYEAHVYGKTQISCSVHIAACIHLPFLRLSAHD